MFENLVCDNAIESASPPVDLWSNNIAYLEVFGASRSLFGFAED